MLFGRYINRYYLKYLYLLLLAVISLLVVDYAQLEIPRLYNYLINGINEGVVDFNGEIIVFDFPFVLQHICQPMMWIIVIIVICRFLWRVFFFGAGIRIESDLRLKMFDHCKNLSQEYYQVNKVGALMSLFTNDIDSVQECLSWGTMMLVDALFLGVIATVKMCQLNVLLTLLSLIPMLLLLIVSIIFSKSSLEVSTTTVTLIACLPFSPSVISNSTV